MQRLCYLIVLTLLVAGCADPKTAKTDTLNPEIKILDNGEPSHITVQHCLIGFSGSVRGKNISRSKEEAQKLAEEVLAAARSGEDFDALIKKHTDDSPPGIYNMANAGIAGYQNRADPSSSIYERTGMVPAFGDVGFTLKVGEFGMSSHNATTSPYGWHIIKRIK